MEKQIKLIPEWLELLKNEFEKPYMNILKQHLISEKNKGKTIMPAGNLIFNALNNCKPNDIKCVILGQDPYHGEGQANGLSFSVNDNMRLPPSLKNIFKETNQDLNINNGKTGNLLPWAKQGVLLLNAILTVNLNEPLSHQQFGWQTFTDYIIKQINQLQNPIIFMLWGNFARSKKLLITNPIHLILESAHPSPLSAYQGFFGNNHFSKSNTFLLNNNMSPIDWSL